MTPQRIQRKRTKGWKKPENTVYVEHGTGIPDAETAVAKYAVWLMGSDISAEMARADIRIHLRGKNLMCWCPLDQPCHADVLLEIANGETE